MVLGHVYALGGRPQPLWQDPEVDAGRLKPVGFGHQRLDARVIASGKTGRQKLHQRVEALDGITLQCVRSFVGRQGAVQLASTPADPALQGVGVRDRGALGQPASLD